MSEPQTIEGRFTDRLGLTRMALIFNGQYMKASDVKMWCPNMNLPGNQHAKMLQLEVNKQKLPENLHDDALPKNWYFTGLNHNDEIVIYRYEIKAAEKAKNPMNLKISLVNMSLVTAQDGDEWNSTQAVIGNNL